MNALLLICALTVAQADCNAGTASVVIQGPETRSLVECQMHGQAYIAESVFADHLDGSTYLKVVCSPKGRRVVV